MQDYENYELTPLGESALQASITTLSLAQMELLVRIDRTLTVAQIKASMPLLLSEEFAAIFRELLERRLLKLAADDPFMVNTQAQINSLALSIAEANADIVSLSIKRAGYYVSIAYERADRIERPAGHVFSAVVVEDDPTLAKFIQSYLLFEGFNVRLACNRLEVIAEFRNPSVPDLILLDVMLPDADGFAILLRLREHRLFKDVPVIMLTGKSSREAVIKGLVGGANGYITKPFLTDSLMRAIWTVLGVSDKTSTSNSQQGPWGRSGEVL